jgi:hypothetical protein
MEKVFSFVISAGLIALGAVIVVWAKSQPDAIFAWTAIGLVPIATGLISLVLAVNVAKVV